MRDHYDLDSDMRHDGAPDVRVLRDKVSVARTGHELSCGCFIAAGERYRSVALLEDGKFHRSKEHVFWQECRLNGGEMHAKRYAEEMAGRDADLDAAYAEMARQEMERRCPECNGAGPPHCPGCDGTGERHSSIPAPTGLIE